MNLVVIRALAIPPKYINSEPYAQTSPIGARKTIMDGTTTFGSASDGSVDLVGCVHSDEPVVSLSASRLSLRPHTSTTGTFGCRSAVERMQTSFTDHGEMDADTHVCVSFCFM